MPSWDEAKSCTDQNLEQELSDDWTEIIFISQDSEADQMRKCSRLKRDLITREVFSSGFNQTFVKGTVEENYTTGNSIYQH